MKNSTAPNRKTGRMIAKNLIVLFAVALAGFCGIQAWFTDKSSADANGINVECQAPDGIEIAVVKHGADAPAPTAYKNTIELNSKNYSFINDIKMTEVSSDGYTFYKPPLKQENGVATPILDADEWELANSSVHYLSFDLYVRSKSKFDIYLDGKSKISPNAKNLTGENADNKSDFGESGVSKGISRDCVTGAVRFSVANYETSETMPKLLWIPAPNILLNVNSDTTQYSVNTKMHSGKSYSHDYYEKSGSEWVKKSVSADGDSPLGKVLVANSKGFTDNGDYTYELGSKKKIMTLSLEKDTTQNDIDIYTGMVTCNMWVDGEDAEARLALVNGKFKANLVLSKADVQQ